MILSKFKKNTLIVSSVLFLSANTFAAEGDIGLSSAKEAFSGITSLATEFISMAWPLVTLIVAATIGIKLFKKFTSKAS